MVRGRLFLRRPRRTSDKEEPGKQVWWRVEKKPRGSPDESCDIWRAQYGKL
jgi:hypothetical protein